MEPLHNASVDEVSAKVRDMHDIKEVISKTNFELRFGVSRVLGGRKVMIPTSTLSLAG
jgi:hypothetical protein